MIVLVPVSMFNVPYKVARGRPYSRLEQRVLEDIAAREGATLASLCETFQVHERLLVEAVVTLVGAGWVAVASGREATFVLTDEGQKARTSGKDPASVTVLSAAPSSLIFDRTTGQLARRGEVPTISPEDARLDLNPCTPERIRRNALDESQVQKLLPRASGEWVRGIGPARLTTFRRYIAVRVDLAEESVVGLPRAWYQALSGEVLEVARYKQEEDEENTVLEPAPGALSPTRDSAAVLPPANVPLTSASSPLPVGPTEPPHTATPAVHAGSTRVTPLIVSQRRQTAATSRPSVPPPPEAVSYPWLDDERPEANGDGSADAAMGADLLAVLDGWEAHERLLAEALSVAAQHVLIASPVASLERLSKLGDALRAAVTRGVRVDLLYGDTDEVTDPQAVVKLLHRFGYDAAARRGRDLLRPAPQRTHSGASLLLFDRGGGPLEAVVGGHVWCGPGTDDRPSSVHLRGSEFMAQVARAAGGLWVWSGAPESADRWRRVAEQCQDDAALETVRGGGDESQVPAELIVDDEHAGVMGAPPGDNVYFGGANRRDQGAAVGIRGVTVAMRRSDVEEARSTP
ncbi:hypothetical protein ABZZ36_39785 [Actinacidiphila glaucinigra]|uniref:hypothetical protein n=1 Tax=Actinacidiphila glaucinigra TaxID=235986 RepID=UPI0033A82FF8